MIYLNSTIFGSQTIRFSICYGLYIKMLHLDDDTIRITSEHLYVDTISGIKTKQDVS